jgi:outer membrane protein assembly factor BamD (BamD/ComL family)
MLDNFKQLQKVCDSIESLENIINSMDLKPTLNKSERVLQVPTDKIDVLIQAKKLIKEYNLWKEEEE